MIRKICDQCNRPSRVCVCDGMPLKLIELETNVLVLSDPDEQKKKTIGTVPLIKLCIKNCDVIYAQSKQRIQNVRNLDFEILNENPLLINALQNPTTLILWPGENVQYIEDMQFEQVQRTIILIDGTWQQASRIVKQTKILQDALYNKNIQRIQFKQGGLSQYQFRKEPLSQCLSTLESLAYTLSLIEQSDDCKVACKHLQHVFQIMVDKQVNFIKESQNIYKAIQKKEFQEKFNLIQNIPKKEQKFSQETNFMIYLRQTYKDENDLILKINDLNLNDSSIIESKDYKNFLQQQEDKIQLQKDKNRKKLLQRKNK